MNERPTPETDAETMRDEYDHVDSDLGPFAPSDTVTAEFARKLERERDEARSMTEHQWLLKVGSRLCVAGCKSDGIVDSIDEIIRERDEAREAFVIATDQMVQAQCKTREALRERDAAQEVLRMISAADWKTAGELRGMARRALEGEE